MDTARKSPGFLHLLPLKGGGEWLHMCIRHKETSTYLMDEVALDDLIVDALMEEDTRSRLRVRDEGIMVLLKAMHLRGEDMARPEDMISMRLWLTPDRVISTREADVDPILEIARRLAEQPCHRSADTKGAYDHRCDQGTKPDAAGNHKSNQNMASFKGLQQEFGFACGETRTRLRGYCLKPHHMPRDAAVFQCEPRDAHDSGRDREQDHN